MAAHLTRLRALDARPVWLVTPANLLPDGISDKGARWLQSCDFDGKPGSLILIPAENGQIEGAVFGAGSEGPDERLIFGRLATGLPDGNWYFANLPAEPELAALGFLLGGYRFDQIGRAHV